MAHTPPGTGADVLVGHRLVRRVGTGTRSEVYLAAATAGPTGAHPVALKVFRRGSDPESIGREVRALLGTPPSTLPRLIDVATAEDGRVCLLLDYLPGPTLDRLLRDRGRIDAAELVTVAATVTATLQALHSVGLSCPLVRPSAVRFDRRGRPMLAGLGGLVKLPEGAAGVAVRRDAAVGLASHVQTLLAYLDPQDAAAASARALLAEFTSVTVARPFPATLDGLEAALFRWAAAGPVRGAVPGGVRDDGRAVVVRDHADPTRGDSPVPRLIPVGVSDAAPAPVIPVDLVRGAARVALGRLRDGWTRLWGAPPQRRRSDGSRRVLPLRPVLLCAGLVVALSAGGLALVSSPPSGPGAGGPAVADVGARSRPGDQGPGDQGADATEADTTEADTTEADSVERAQQAGDGSAIEGDDPVAAVLALLRQREVCLAEASVLCLDDVHQAGSVAMAADGYRIRHLQSGPDAADPLGGSAASLDAELQERTGNAALVTLSDASGAGVNAQPASALVIKGEAGWRLRELFDY
jgi:hypothetical protein